METQTKRLGEHEYTVHPLGALKGRKLLVKLIRVMGPALGSDPEKALDALDAGVFEEVCDTFADSSFVTLPSGKAPKVKEVFDLHFAQKYGEMIQWILFSLEVNYGGFFAELGAIGSSLGAKGQPSKSPKE